MTNKPTHHGAITEAIESIKALNTAIDYYWNDERGLRTTGMGDTFVYQITNAQGLQKQALQKLEALRGKCSENLERGLKEELNWFVYDAAETLHEALQESEG